MKTRARAVALTVVALTALMGGCKVTDDKPCSDGSFPVRGAGNSPGGSCVKSGDPVPSGYETYPAGQTPTTYPAPESSAS